MPRPQENTVEEYKVFLLASGDGDFARLLEHLKGKYKKTVAISHKQRTSHQLIRSANQVIFLNGIRVYVEKVQAQP